MFADTLVGVYILPEILPPPVKIVHVPPLGTPDIVFVPVSQMREVSVVLLAIS